MRAGSRGRGRTRRRAILAGVKPALGAVLSAVVAIAVAAILLARERRVREDLDRRVAALEAERALPAPVVPDGSAPAARVAPGDAPAVPEAAQPEGKPEENPRLRKLEDQIARLEARLRELNRAAEGAAVEDVAGLSADEVWQKAQIALQDKLSSRASALLREFLRRFPGDPRTAEALLSVGFHGLTTGGRDEALAAYGRILSEFPDSKAAAQAEFYTGMLYAETGDLARAKEHYEKSVERFAGNSYWQAAALLNLGDAYAAQGQPAVAREYWSRVASQFSSDPQNAKLVRAAEDKLKAPDKK